MLIQEIVDRFGLTRASCAGLLLSEGSLTRLFKPNMGVTPVGTVNSMNLRKYFRLAISVILPTSVLIFTASPVAATGVTGIDAYVINSNGVRCGQACVSQSQAQVALCVVSSEDRINYVNVTYGYTLRKGSESISTASYPPVGTTLVSSSTCSAGYMQTWDFRDLIADTEYIVDTWMTNDSITYSNTLTFTTQSVVTTPTTNPLSTSTTIAVDTLIPGRPLVSMYEGPGVGAWNLVDDSNGQVLTSSVCTPVVCGINGEWRTWPSNRLLNNRHFANGYPEGATYYWNPIGAGSGGQYYTNGLYVTSWGQHILPGTSTLVDVVSAPAPTTIPETIDDGGGSGGDSNDPSPDEPTTTTSTSTTTSTTSTTLPVPVDANSVQYGSDGFISLAPAKLSVSFLNRQFRILVTTPASNTSFIVKATAQGKRTITWTSTTGKLTTKRITSARSLKGYTLTVYVAGVAQTTITVS
jgi:hypothetical protein